MVETQPNQDSSPQGTQSGPKSRRGSGPRRRRAGSKKPSESLPLHQRSASHFQAADRRRGERYFSQDRVKIDVDGHRGLARVEGTERDGYAVGIDWTRVGEERRLHVYCECERFAGGTPCKHIWATLLQLATSHPDQQPRGRNRVGLRKDSADRWPEFGGGQPAEAQKQHPKKKRPKSRKKRGKRSRGGADSWRARF